MITVVLIAIVMATIYAIIGIFLISILLGIIKSFYKDINNLDEEELKHKLDKRVKKINSTFEKFWKKILKK